MGDTPGERLFCIRRAPDELFESPRIDACGRSKSIEVSKKESPDKQAAQLMIANTTAVVNGLPLPPAYRARSISLIEFSRFQTRRPG
jgi:hypothetical protein